MIVHSNLRRNDAKIVKFAYNNHEKNFVYIAIAVYKYTYENVRKI